MTVKAMTVKELIEALQKYDPNMIVVINSGMADYESAEIYGAIMVKKDTRTNFLFYDAYADKDYIAALLIN